MTRSWWNSKRVSKSRAHLGSRDRTKWMRSLTPQLERLEERCVLSGVFRTIDGSNNNDAHPDWGSAGEDLLRKGPAAYADGLNAPVIGNPQRPSPRLVSDVVVAQTTDERELSDRFMSAMIYAWGQFVDHDLDLTPNDSPPVAFNISVPVDPNDPFSTAAGGPGTIFFNRSDYDPATGLVDANGKKIPRQQPNVITAFLDGSMVYGSDDVVANKLRTHDGGKLKTSPGDDGAIGTQDDLLPLNNTTYFPDSEGGPLTLANDAHRVGNEELFAAGDVRVNENIELTSLHTLFVREHNRVASLLHAAFPNLNDEALYQRARSIVGAEIQAVTYNQWLPTLLGGNAIKSYAGYNPKVNPGITNEFSTASFRFGHSMLGDEVEFRDNDGEEVRENVDLNDAFFNPPLLTENGIGPILKYLASDPSSEVDSSIVDPVRNFLFGEPGAGGFDLASLNIQRGRDHGLADYNTTRAAYGLPKVTSFAQITSDPVLQLQLKTLYGNVNNIDLWVGGLAEDHVAGGSTGPLVRAVLKDQFERLRDGDSFWYEQALSDPVVRLINNTTLADIIARNTEIDNLQNNVFLFKLSISGTVFNDADRNGRQGFREGGIAGRTIQLLSVEDGEATVLATTQTDKNGSYRFDVADRMELGTYQVREVLPPGVIQTTPDPADIVFTRGGQLRIGVNFGNAKGSLSGIATLSLTSDQPLTAAIDSSTSPSITIATSAATGSSSVTQTPLVTTPPTSSGTTADGNSQDNTAADDDGCIADHRLRDRFFAELTSWDGMWTLR
jgi:peroxidase